MKSGLLDVDHIRESHRATRLGRQIEYLESTGSTNDVARRFAEASDTDGLVVLADHQSAGRGRLGRTWHAPRGASVLMSVVLTARASDWSAPQLALVTGVALCDAVLEAVGVLPCIKWPNDIILSGKKVGGVLVESVERPDGGGVFIVGIGVNCLQHACHWPADCADIATSLDLESPGPIDRASLVVAILHHLDRWLADPSRWHADDLHDAWLRRSEPPGSAVRLREGGRLYSGTILDIDPTAALVVQLDVGGVRAFNAASTTRHVDTDCA